MHQCTLLLDGWMFSFKKGARNRTICNIIWNRAIWGMPREQLGCANNQWQKGKENWITFVRIFPEQNPIKALFFVGLGGNAFLVIVYSVRAQLYPLWLFWKNVTWQRGREEHLRFQLSHLLITRSTATVLLIDRTSILFFPNRYIVVHVSSLHGFFPFQKDRVSSRRRGFVGMP